MRKRNIVPLLFAVLLMGVSSVWAWTPPRGGCASILANVICSGTPVTITGQIIGVYPGRGYVIQSGGENVTVCGMGPIWYWRRIGVAKPRIGENITVDGYEISLPDGSTTIVAMKVTTQDGNTVQLRDPQTCYPLWFKR